MLFFFVTSSQFTWCARQIKSISCRFKNYKQIQIQLSNRICLTHFSDNISAEREWNTAIIFSPPLSFFIRIGPVIRISLGNQQKQRNESITYHNKSHSKPEKNKYVYTRFLSINKYRPVSGTSVGRIMRRICSIVWRSGDKPLNQKRNESNVTILRMYTSMTAKDLFINNRSYW